MISISNYFISDTGTCLNCTGNTAGPKCDSCAFDSYFDEIEKRCTKCNCNLDGVITFKNKSDVSCDQVIQVFTHNFKLKIISSYLEKHSM